jgi:glycosyltransferase involved in cell wall biosynthesis
MGEHKRRAPRPRLTVAVCIPTIPGREAALRRAVASVHAQTRAADRILIQRDDARRGAAASRNRLLERVDTDVIAWLDDDDWLAPNHLRACMRVLEEHPETGLVYPRPRMVGGADPTATRYQGRFPVSPWGLRWQPELENHLRTQGSFIPMTHLVRTDAARRAGGFPEGRVLETGRYQGEDERYLIELLDHGTVFEHLDAKTWFWNAWGGRTAGRGVAEAAAA